MVDDFVGTERLRTLELPVAARRDPHSRASRFRDTHRRLGDTTADSPDENVVARRYSCARYQHSPGSEVCERCRRCVFNRDALWNPSDIGFWNDDIICKRSGSMLTEQTKLHAQRLFASLAVFTRSIAQSRVDDDAISFVEGSHVVTRLVDHAGTVRSHDPWRRDGDSGQTRQREYVEVIEGGGMYSHAHRSRGGLGSRHVGEVFKLVCAAVRGDGECSQRKPCGLY